MKAIITTCVSAVSRCLCDGLTSALKAAMALTRVCCTSGHVMKPPTRVGSYSVCSLTLREAWSRRLTTISSGVIAIARASASASRQLYT